MDTEKSPEDERPKMSFRVPDNLGADRLTEFNHDGVTYRVQVPLDAHPGSYLDVELARKPESRAGSPRTDQPMDNGPHPTPTREQPLRSARNHTGEDVAFMNMAAGFKPGGAFSQWSPPTKETQAAQRQQWPDKFQSLPPPRQPPPTSPTHNGSSPVSLSTPLAGFRPPTTDQSANGADPYVIMLHGEIEQVEAMSRNDSSKAEELRLKLDLLRRLEVKYQESLRRKAEVKMLENEVQQSESRLLAMKPHLTAQELAAAHASIGQTVPELGRRDDGGDTPPPPRPGMSGSFNSRAASPYSAPSAPRNSGDTRSAANPTNRAEQFQTASQRMGGPMGGPILPVGGKMGGATARNGAGGSVSFAADVNMPAWATSPGPYARPPQQQYPGEAAFAEAAARMAEGGDISPHRERKEFGTPSSPQQSTEASFATAAAKLTAPSMPPQEPSRGRLHNNPPKDPNDPFDANFLAAAARLGGPEKGGFGGPSAKNRSSASPSGPWTRMRSPSQGAQSAPPESRMMGGPGSARLSMQEVSPGPPKGQSVQFGGFKPFGQRQNSRTPQSGSATMDARGASAFGGPGFAGWTNPPSRNSAAGAHGSPVSDSRGTMAGETQNGSVGSGMAPFSQSLQMPPAQPNPPDYQQLLQQLQQAQQAQQTQPLTAQQQFQQQLQQFQQSMQQPPQQQQQPPQQPNQASQSPPGQQFAVEQQQDQLQAQVARLHLQRQQQQQQQMEEYQRQLQRGGRNPGFPQRSQQPGSSRGSSAQQSAAFSAMGLQQSAIGST